MPLNAAIAIWLVNLLCPELGKHNPEPHSQAPDFVEDVDYQTVHEWAEYAAKQPSTLHHLNRCLKK
jgi:hypothetical protein